MAKRALPEKCRKCGMLSAEQAQALHGAAGDGCWNPSVCYSRRSYARNRDRINQTRSRKRKEGELEQIPVEFEPLSQTVFGVLVVYRKGLCRKNLLRTNDRYCLHSLKQQFQRSLR